ncbi:hypothetical protein OROGR_011772 [Orobanche gracilis]
MTDRKREHAILTLTPDAGSSGSKGSKRKHKTLAPDAGSPGDDPKKQLASPVKARRSLLRKTFIGPDGSLYRAIGIPSPRRRKFKEDYPVIVDLWRPVLLLKILRSRSGTHLREISEGLDSGDYEDCYYYQFASNNVSFKQVQVPSVLPLQMGPVSPGPPVANGPISPGPPVSNGPISPGPPVANDPFSPGHPVANEALPPLLGRADIAFKYGEMYTEYVRKLAEFREHILSLPEEAFHDELSDDEEEVSDYASAYDVYA